jgi:GDP/UDP-N,N'-diacetylbacillosamine 2-epimerase (hydrolysing)
VNIQKNEYYAKQVAQSLEELSQDFQIIITMPNADTMSNIIREVFAKIISKKHIIHTVESLGSVGYYSCLENACFLIGNSSSGIVEAASFGKYVINLGDRQKGREAGNNVIHSIIEQKEIVNNALKISKLPDLKNQNIYGDGNTTNRICDILKEI